jgi:hypothetical protein
MKGGIGGKDIWVADYDKKREKMGKHKKFRYRCKHTR